MEEMRMLGVLPNFNTDPPNKGDGFNDVRDLETIKKSPKKVVSREYHTDGTGISVGEANTADPDVLESLRYPHQDQQNKPSISGLSRNDLHDYDLISSRKNKQRPFVKTANKQNFREPSPSYAPKYPFNQVLETESGHSLEFDDTPGNERVTISHRAGSFVEYYPTGSKIEEVVKNNYKIVMSDDHIYVMGKVFIATDSDVYVKSKGDVYLESGNDVDIKVSGKMNISVKEGLNIRAQNINMETEEELTAVSGSSQFFTSSSDVNIMGSGGVYATGSSVDILSSGDANIQGGGSVNLAGSKINLNSGGGASSASEGSAAGIEAPEARSIKNDNPPSVDGPSDFEIISGNDDFDLPTEIHMKVLEDAGLPPPNTVPLEDKGASTPPAGGEDKPVSCGSVQLQDNYKAVKVSKNFTLADFTQGGSRKLQDQYGATKADLLCNIVKLAENILEPLMDAGFTFKITSCYRRGEADLPAAAAASHNSTGTYKISDHDLARAVDITLIKKNGVSLSAFDAANQIYPLVGKISKQFLLEYETSGGGGWLHIAYAQGLKSAMPSGTLKDHNTYARNQFVNLKPNYVA